MTNHMHENLPHVLIPPEDAVRRYEEFVHQRGKLAGWVELPGYTGAWKHVSNGLYVIETVNVERDLLTWLHVSLSRTSRIPTWDDTKLVRNVFIGDDREAYAIFPPEDRWVNIHPYVLHLWTCLDAPTGVLPDMRHMGVI